MFSVFEVFSMAFPSSGWLFHMFSHGPGFTPRSRLRAGTLGAPGAGPVNGKMDGLRFFDVPNNHWDKEHVPKKLGHSPYFLVHNILKADMFLGSRCNSTLYGRSCTLGNCSAEGIFLATGKKLIDHQTLGFHCKHREIYVILPEIVWAILSNYKCIWKNRDGIRRDWSGSGGPSGWYFCRIPQTGTSAKQIFSNVIGVGCIYAQYIEYHRTIMNYIHIYINYIYLYNHICIQSLLFVTYISRIFVVVCRKTFLWRGRPRVPAMQAADSEQLSKLRQDTDFPPRLQVNNFSPWKDTFDWLIHWFSTG